MIAYISFLCDAHDADNADDAAADDDDDDDGDVLTDVHALDPIWYSCCCLWCPAQTTSKETLYNPFLGRLYLTPTRLCTHALFLSL